MTTTTTTTATRLAVSEATLEAALAELENNPEALARVHGAADEAKVKHGDLGLATDEVAEYQRLKAQAEGVAFTEAREFGQTLSWAKSCAAAAGGAFKRGFMNHAAFPDKCPDDLATLYEQAAWRKGVEAGQARAAKASK